MENEIIVLLAKYGLPALVMAVIVVCLVGIVKIFTKGVVVQKEVSEKKKKWLAKLYMLLALVFSAGCVLIYNGLILKVNILNWGIVSQIASVYLFTDPLYNFYKQLGGRKFLIWFVSLFKGKNEKLDEVLVFVENVLNEDAPYLTDEQKASITNKIVSLLEKKKTYIEVEENKEKEGE